ncbi:MAG: GPR endopeptidase [Defluviitaleaceae bacterium]|nr:GPR endopeptidase [Defluviitaleaceae bacterium]
MKDAIFISIYLKISRILQKGITIKMTNNTFANMRTDLALEQSEILREGRPDDSSIDGVEIKTEEVNNIIVTWVKIVNEKGAEAMGKPIGNYITIESEAMKDNDIDAHEEIIKIMAQKLGQLHKLNKNGSVLAAGLGNWQVTPDALGPKVIEKLLVTRHMNEILPEELQDRVRSMAAIAPGVMGNTGIETGEIIKGVAERIKPDLILAIDALAARRTNRINATIQMTDTGINPGAGLGNKRMRLNKETMGVPVIAIGVPTVVDAATLVNDTMNRMLTEMIREASQGSPFYEMLVELEDDEKYGLIKDILDPYAGNMFVTPKEVDAVIDRLTNIIANGVNIAFHPGIDGGDINRYL